MVACISGMERHREQTLLATAEDAVADVEKGPTQLAVDEVTDPAHLFDRIQATRLGGRGGDSRQRRQTLCERSQRQLRLCLRPRERHGDGCKEGGEHSPKLPATERG